MPVSTPCKSASGEIDLNTSVFRSFRHRLPAGRHMVPLRMARPGCENGQTTRAEAKDASEVIVAKTTGVAGLPQPQLPKRALGAKKLWRSQSRLLSLSNRTFSDASTKYNLLRLMASSYWYWVRYLLLYS